jgi:MraZ protein
VEESGEMFRSQSFHTIDEKGRIIVPARFRDVIRASGQDEIMVSRMDGCLVAYTLGEWNQVEERIRNMAVKSEKMRRFRRIFIGGASQCPCDRQGRVLIPPSLREYAVLEKEIVLAGVIDHFEIWSRDRWDNENSCHEEEMKKEDVRNQIAELGL